MDEGTSSFILGSSLPCEQEVSGRGRRGCDRKHRLKQKARAQGFPEFGRSPHPPEVGLCALMFHIIQAMNLVLWEYDQKPDYIFWDSSVTSRSKVADIFLLTGMQWECPFVWQSLFSLFGCQMSPSQSALPSITLCNMCPTPVLWSITNILLDFISFCLYLSLYGIISCYNASPVSSGPRTQSGTETLKEWGLEKPFAFIQIQTFHLFNRY